MLRGPAFCATTAAKSRLKREARLAASRDGQGRAGERPFRRTARPDMNCLFNGSPRATISVWEEFHGSQDEIPGFFHCLGHPFQEWLAGRSGLPLAGELADC